MPRRLRRTDPGGVCPRLAIPSDATARRGRTPSASVPRYLSLVLAVVALVLAGDAAAFDCPNTPVEERLEVADIAFVGTIVSHRPARDRSGERVYRFDVEQRVKGTLGSAVEVRSEPLVDVEDTPVPAGADVGVLATTQRGALVTSSCGLSDPAALLAGADEPRGEWIKLAIGFVIAAAAVLYALVRLRRRRTAESPERVAP
jgi:membrane protein implicated in regulation of membrane protease activity